MTVVCIAGMHRSGTSLVARLLNLCGLYLGPEADLMPANFANPEGYWENLRFVEINDALLRQLDARWDRPPAADTALEMQKQPPALAGSASELIGSFKGRPTWGWKDPRNSLTLPFWQQLIPGLKVIICLRNPLEVAQSLAARDAFSLAAGLELWHEYHRRLLSSVAPSDVITTHYGVYFVNPQAELTRLLRFIGIPPRAATVQAACAAAATSLRHNRSSLEYLIAEGAPLKVVTLYAQLCSEAGPVYWNAVKKAAAELKSASGDPDPATEIGLLSHLNKQDPAVLALASHLARKQLALQKSAEQAAETQQQVQQLSDQLVSTQQGAQDLSRQLAESAGNVQALSQQVSEKENAVVAMSAQLNEKEQALQAASADLVAKEQALQARDALLVEKDQSLAAASARLTEKEEALRAAGAQLIEKDQALELISSGLAWKFVSGFRRIIETVLPTHSVARRMYGSIINGLKGARDQTRQTGPAPAFAHVQSKTASIIIPNYNGKQYLADCLDSLQHLDFPPEQFEVLVVDNGSSDGSGAFVSSQYPDVLVIQAERNLGFAGGCNLGISRARGRYMVLLNNDTVVDAAWLKELVAVAEKDELAAIVGSKLLFKNKPEEIQNAGSYLTTRGDGGDIGTHEVDLGQYDTTREVMAVCGASMLIKRTLIETIGALDEDFVAYYEDVDLCYRARLHGLKVVFAPMSVVYHVHAATSGEWSPQFAFLVFRNKLLMHLKNSPIGFLLKVLALYFAQLINEGIVKGVNRRTHARVLGSLAAKLPRFLLKRWHVRLRLKTSSDLLVLRRLTRVKRRILASEVKKVCVYNAYLPTMGGGENLTAHTISYINRLFPAAAIDLLCHETPTFERSRFSGSDFVQRLQTDFDLALTNTTVRFTKITLRHRSLPGKLWATLRLAALTKQYDLFINNTYGSLLPARAAVNLYSCMFPSRLEDSPNGLVRTLQRVIYNRFLTSYDMFLAISQYTQRWIDRYWDVNSHVLYPAVKLAPGAPCPDKENIVVSVGRFFVGGHSKRQDVMVNAFVEMCNKGLAGDWKLVLVGRKHPDEASDAYILALEQAIKGFPIELRFDETYDELQDLLRRAKLYWHAAGYDDAGDLSPEKAEHFGLSTIEAMQAGAVPVVFNGGGQPEIVVQGRSGYVWNTEDELTAYTRLLMNNEILRNELGTAALKSIQMFGYERQLQWFIQFLGRYYNLEQ